MPYVTEGNITFQYKSSSVSFERKVIHFIKFSIFWSSFALLHMVCAVIREVSHAKMCVKIGFSKQVCICSSEVRAFEFRDTFESDTEIQSRKSHEIFARSA